MRNARYEMLAKAIRTHDFAGCDPHGVAESWRKGEKSRAQLAAIVSTLHGLEHNEFLHALKVLDCRLAAQYAYVRDTLGLAALYEVAS